MSTTKPRAPRGWREERRLRAWTLHIDRAQGVMDFLSQGGAAHIWLDQLPACAPELNPDEGI